MRQIRARKEPDWKHAVLQQGKAALESLEPQSWERTALHWTAERMRRTRTAVRGILVGIGLFWMSIGLLIASLYFPQVRLLLLLMTAGVAFLLGVWFVTLGLQFGARLNRRIERVDEMAQMSNVERHAHIARKSRRRPPDDRIGY